MANKMIYLARRNPSVAQADWPRTWRSHPKFVSQFPVFGAVVDKLSYCSRVPAPGVDGVSQDYDGVAVIASPSEQLHDLQLTPEVQEQILADERRVFSTNVDRFALRGQEVLVLGDAPGPAAVIRFLARKAGVSRDDFLAAWAGQGAKAAEQATKAGKLTRYVRNAVTVEPPPGYGFDGVSEAWFSSVEAAAASFADPQLASLDEPPTAVCDPARTVTMFTEVIFQLPRA